MCLTLQQQYLIKEVTHEEIIEAIKTLPKEKAPGVDGFLLSSSQAIGI